MSSTYRIDFAKIKQDPFSGGSVTQFCKNHKLDRDTLYRINGVQKIISDKGKKIEKLFMQKEYQDYGYRIDAKGNKIPKPSQKRINQEYQK